MAPKKSTAKTSPPVKKATKKQASKKTAASKATPKRPTPKKAVAKKPKAKSPSKPVPATSDGDGTTGDTTDEVTGNYNTANAIATTFHHFKELPLELRLRIWGYAAPEPVVVIQRVSTKNKDRYTYRRKPPAVLHTCRESRLEYLDTDQDAESASVARRRREHPVYKLYFRRNRTRCSPTYFSDDTDSFYGREYMGNNRIPHRLYGSYSLQYKWGGIAELELAKSLKHLIIKRPFGVIISVDYFRQKFPRLEILTLLLPRSWVCDHFSYRHVSVPVPPEVGGQLDIKSLPVSIQGKFYAQKRVFTDAFDKEKVLHPNWTPPAVWIRIDTQFLANANYTP